MNTNHLFKKFNSKIRLSNEKREKLARNRKALRKKIRDYFNYNEWGAPKFYSQGSFPLNTNLNPIKEKYDLDDGVYFICSEEERKESSTYHNRIKKAVKGHASEVKDKNTCVRVVYADGHHIDFPSYWIEKDGNTPQLAHKSDGFIMSDPKAFKQWVEEYVSNSYSRGQLRRIIRYLKAWKDYRENCNSNLRLPSGFILTILACKTFIKEDKRDDLSLKNTVNNIINNLNYSFSCKRPTAPVGEELLNVCYSETNIKSELKKLYENAEEAINSECEKDASEYWQKVFGDRFPIGSETKQEQALGYGIIPTVTATKPYLDDSKL